MSRRKARKLVKGRELREKMVRAGILVHATSLRDLAEEAGFAYKDVHAVAAAAEAGGISRRVAHLSPVGNVKG